jgi:hypothetical protein
MLIIICLNIHVVSVTSISHPQHQQNKETLYVLHRIQEYNYPAAKSL